MKKKTLFASSLILKKEPEPEIQVIKEEEPEIKVNNKKKKIIAQS